MSENQGFFYYKLSFKSKVKKGKIYLFHIDLTNSICNGSSVVIVSHQVIATIMVHAYIHNRVARAALSLVPCPPGNLLAHSSTFPNPIDAWSKNRRYPRSSTLHYTIVPACNHLYSLLTEYHRGATM